MAVSFARIRIAGFKSFAEAQTVEILPGLTGVVGPNGCGKSNVVEALRWAMGESSARSLRGGEMDDVIFAGTANRPSRNLAEVVLTLEDAAGAAPPPFHEQPELQISRKIERGAGSAFRVNGREVRARDVQTLFADLASGARSAAMVSQGRVSTVINARPEERRAVLEEAAGITGLHARRHEAELKLRAAEANGGRAEDLKTQLDGQLAGLQRQAKQANRYRTLATAVKEAEADLLAIGRARTERDRDGAKAVLASAQDAVVAAASTAIAMTAAAGNATAGLPALRSAEAEARTALERARILREQVAAEADRARDALAAAATRQTQVARDLQQAERAAADAASAATRLAEEDARLQAAAADAPARLAAADSASREAADQAATADAAANTATEKAAELSASSQAITQALAGAEARAKRLAQQLAQLRADHARAAAQTIDAAKVAEAAGAAEAAEAAFAAARTALETAERARAAGQDAAAKSRDKAAAAAAAAAKLTAETQALAEVLAVKDGERWPPMVDQLTVPAGLEAALGAVLGEELSAASNPGAPRHWRELPDLPPAAMPGTPLGSVVQGPAVLNRALAGIALVDGDAAGEAAQPTLSAGQVLVSREGAIWRWDGYTIRAGTPTAAAVRLRQRNRLAGLQVTLAAAKGQAAATAAARSEADAADRATVAAETIARTARRDAEAARERTRAAAARLRADAETASNRLAALDVQLERLTPEAAEADTALADLRAEQSRLPDLTVLRRAVETARAALAAARKAEATSRGELAGLRRDAAARDTRLRSIVAEAEDWRLRAGEAGGRLLDLRARGVEAASELARTQAAPHAAAAQMRDAVEALEAAEATHRRASASLEAAVNADTAAARMARAAETTLAAAREAVVRAESSLAQANHAWGTMAERILERLGVNPTLPNPTDLSAEAEDRARRRLERQAKEREEMGPVNLRAELEATEVEARLSTLATEREELNTAIAKLRGSIGHINREGRERLATVFNEVDRHFQALFSRMFGGGKAHLAMVGSDDPLQAGLEIYAQPPGKKLATLSLLSGGEQALTALSLIFAVFRCNPAPICVLDEVDAPLDDANVARFCALLGEMVQETGTRFLVVTHHHLTMARMDRLYGVTMQERGVSRLLSVDLVKATEMVDQLVAAE